MIKFADFKAPVIASVEMGVDEDGKAIVHEFKDNTVLALEYDKLSRDRIALASDNVEMHIEACAKFVNDEAKKDEYLSGLTLADQQEFVDYKMDIEQRQLEFILAIIDFTEYGYENTLDNAKLIGSSAFEDGKTLLEKIADYYQGKDKRLSDKSVGKHQGRR